MQRMLIFIKLCAFWKLKQTGNITSIIKNRFPFKKNKFNSDKVVKKKIQFVEFSFTTMVSGWSMVKKKLRKLKKNPSRDYIHSWKIILVTFLITNFLFFFITNEWMNSPSPNFFFIINLRCYIFVYMNEMKLNWIGFFFLC